MVKHKSESRFSYCNFIVHAVKSLLADLVKFHGICMLLLIPGELKGVVIRMLALKVVLVLLLSFFTVSSIQPRNLLKSSQCELQSESMFFSLQLRISLCHVTNQH